MRHSGICSSLSSPSPAQAVRRPSEPRHLMVISCRSGQVREAWWSTVPSIRSFSRLGGTGMPPVSPGCGGCGARFAVRGPAMARKSAAPPGYGGILPWLP